MFLKIIFQETSSLLNTAKYGVALKNIDQVAENFFLVGGGGKGGARCIFNLLSELIQSTADTHSIKIYSVYLCRCAGTQYLTVI